MNQNIRLDFESQDGRKYQDTLGSERIARVYADAYDKAGYKIVSLTNTYTGKKVSRNRRKSL